MGKATVILSLDPSSTCVGYCVATAGERLIDAGKITPPSKLQNPMLRIDSLVSDVLDLALEQKPDVVLVEIPGGKVHGRISGKGHGLSTYGFACGRIYEAVARALPDSHIVGVLESDWTQRIPKATRAKLVTHRWPQIDLSSDKGLDAADAAGLVLWWLHESRTRLLSGVGA